jgi:FXSXX-COOH protein
VTERSGTITAMSADLEDAPLSSRVPDLSRVPLGKMEEHRGELDKVLGRLLPKPEAQGVPVAAFNSSI